MSVDAIQWVVLGKRCPRIQKPAASTAASTEPFELRVHVSFFHLFVLIFLRRSLMDPRLVSRLYVVLLPHPLPLQCWDERDLQPHLDLVSGAPDGIGSHFF